MVESIGDILRDLFFPENPEKTFKIPRFQRGYSWTTDNVTDFLYDLDARLKDNLAHHFGTLFMKTDDKSSVREIIDGQQRITTVVLYLIACRDFLKKYENDVDQFEKIAFAQKLKEINSRLEPKDTSIPHILKVGKTNEHLFAKLYPVDDPDTKLTCTTEGDDDIRLLNAYSIIIDDLNKKFYDEQNKTVKPAFWSGIVENYTLLLSQFRLATLSVESIARAFTIFETINDRGEELNQTDLIKNYFFGLLSEQKTPLLSESVLDTFAERWADMRKRITGSGTSYKFDDFVRHVLLIQYDIEEKKDELYKGIKKVIVDKGVTPQAVFDDLEKWTEVFVKLRSPDKVTKWTKETTNQSLKILRNLRAVHAYPTLMQGYSEYFVKKKYSTFKDLARLLLTIQIRTKQILDRKESDVSGVTKEITAKIKDGKSWTEILKPIKANHKTEKAIFEAGLDHFKSKNSAVVKYILESAPIGNLKIPGVQIEHIMPQKIEKWKNDIITWDCIPNVKLKNLSKEEQEQYVKTYQNEFVDFIGNQMLLEDKINDKIKNDKFVDKQKEYVNSQYKEAKRIGKLPNKQWTANDIIQRQLLLKTTMSTLFTCK